MSEKPAVKMVGEDGNSFAILARCRRAAQQSGWPAEQLQRFIDEATSGDYDHLLATVMKQFDVDPEPQTKDPWEMDRQLNLLRSGICSLCNVPNQFLRCDSLGRWVCPDCHTEQD